MQNRRVRVPRLVLAATMCLGIAATASFGAAWEGLQLESTMPIDTTQPRSEVALDISASAFMFHPVVVTIVDKPKKAKKVVKLEINVKNNSDDDYFIYATAILLDAEGKTIATKGKKDKMEEDDPEDLHIKFKLSYAEIERVESCTLKFAFEED